MLRANFAKEHGDSVRVEYSQAYLFFYDQLEKANLMLQGVIDCANKPINDTEHHVHLFLDCHLKEAETLSFHPNDCILLKEIAA